MDTSTFETRILNVQHISRRLFGLFTITHLGAAHSNYNKNVHDGDKLHRQDSCISLISPQCKWIDDLISSNISTSTFIHLLYWKSSGLSA